MKYIVETGGAALRLLQLIAEGLDLRRTTSVEN